MSRTGEDNELAETGLCAIAGYWISGQPLHEYQYTGYLAEPYQ